eukprot:344245-Prymnesium_polylepis.1
MCTVPVGCGRPSRKRGHTLVLELEPRRDKTADTHTHRPWSPYVARLAHTQRAPSACHVGRPVERRPLTHTHTARLAHHHDLSHTHAPAQRRHTHARGVEHARSDRRLNVRTAPSSR